MRGFALVFTFFMLFFGLSAKADNYCVSSDVGILRAEARTSSKQIIKYSMYTPLKSTGKKEGSFIFVQDFRGRKGWIHQSHIRADLSCVAVKASRVKLKSGPGSEFETLWVPAKGEGFKDLGGEDGWTQVENAKGEKAWIHLDKVWRPSTTLRMSFDK